VRRKFWAGAAFVFTLIAFSFLPAQSQESSPGPLVRSETNRVLVDIEVLDHSTPVENLRKEQFHVFDDGQEQPILSFEAQTGAQPGKAPQTVAEPNTYSNATQYPAGAAINVLLLDGLNTQVANQADVRRQMIEYLEKVPAGTPLALYTLGTQLRVLQGFTTDAAAIVRILKSEQANARPSPLIDPAAEDGKISRELQQQLAARGFIQRVRQFEAEEISYNTDMRVAITLQALRQLARALGGLPGRKNVYWFSGSFPLTLIPDANMAQLFDSFSATRDYDRDLLATGIVLGKARVSVYPIDAGGLTGISGYLGENARMDNHRQSTEDRMTTQQSGEVGMYASQRENGQNTMKQLARDTGGEAFVNTNDFGAILRKALAQGASYYTVSIAPRPSADKARYHHIKVVVDGGKYSLAYRPGYVAEPASGPVIQPSKNPILEAALLDEPPAAQVQFQARILPASDPEIKTGPKLAAGTQGKMPVVGATDRVVVDSLIDLRTLACAADADGVRECKLELLVMAYGDKKKPVNYADRGMSVRLKPELFQKRLETGIPVRMELDLPAGTYQVRVAVRDVSVQTVGSVQAPLVLQ
jgi:VWFA-related protein